MIHSLNKCHGSVYPLLMIELLDWNNFTMSDQCRSWFFWIARDNRLSIIIVRMYTIWMKMIFMTNGLEWRMPKTSLTLKENSDIHFILICKTILLIIKLLKSSGNSLFDRHYLWCLHLKCQILIRYLVCLSSLNLLWLIWPWKILFCKGLFLRNYNIVSLFCVIQRLTSWKSFIVISICVVKSFH